MSVVSLSTKAGELPVADTIPLMAFPLPMVQITLGDVVALGGFAIVLARFIIDMKRSK